MMSIIIYHNVVERSFNQFGDYPVILIIGYFGDSCPGLFLILRLFHRHHLSLVHYLKDKRNRGFPFRGILKVDSG